MKLGRALPLLILLGCAPPTKDGRQIIALADEAVRPIRTVSYEFESREVKTGAPADATFSGSLWLERMTDSTN